MTALSVYHGKMTFVIHLPHIVRMGHLKSFVPGMRYSQLPGKHITSVLILLLIVLTGKSLLPFVFKEIS